MAKEQDPVKDLRASLSAARKKEMNFALCMGKKAEGIVLLIDRIKDPSVLFKQAKREGETAKLAYGTIKIDGSNALLKCIDEPPPGCGRKLKQFFSKTVGMKLKVIIQDIDGQVLEADEEDGEEGEGQGAETTEENAAANEWAEVQERLKPEIDAFLQAGRGDVARVRKVWDFACTKADQDEDFDAALNMAAKIPAILEEAAEEEDVADAGSDGSEEQAGDGQQTEEAPSGADPSDRLAETLRNEFDGLSADISAAATSLNKGAAKKTGILAERFSTELANDPKRAGSVLTLLKTTLKAALDAGVAEPELGGGRQAEERRSRLADLENSVDELLAEFA